MKNSYDNIINNSIFHFTKKDTFIEYILPNFQLKFGLLKNTNDPRETKTFGFGAVNGNFEAGNEITDKENKNKMLSGLLKDKVKVICFSTDYKIDNEYFDGYNLPRMWAHYGDNHKGVCLEIDLDILIEENSAIFKNIHSSKVNYTHNFMYPYVEYDQLRQYGIEQYIANFKLLHRDYLYFTKHIDWETERELRLLYFSNFMIDEYVSIRKSLKTIILGIDFDKTELPKIIEQTKNISIEQIIFNSNQLKSFAFTDEYLK